MTMALKTQNIPSRQTVVASFGEFPAPFKMGLIVLSSDMVLERDFGLMMPPCGEVAFYSSRVHYPGTVDEESLRLMGPLLAEAASTILPTSKLDVIAYGCTSASVLIGPEEVASQILEGRPDVTVVTPISAAIAAFKSQNVRRISLMTPYTRNITQTMANFIEAQGIEVLNFAYFDLVDDQEIAKLTPDRIHDAALEISHPEADAVFLSCTGVRSVETIGRLETSLGKRAFCSNQCMFWQSLRLSGYTKPISGFGQLLMT